jgi:hypothetical protein
MAKYPGSDNRYTGTKSGTNCGVFDTWAKKVVAEGMTQKAMERLVIEMNTPYIEMGRNADGGWRP